MLKAGLELVLGWSEENPGAITMICHPSKGPSAQTDVQYIGDIKISWKGGSRGKKLSNEAFWEDDS